MLKGRHLIEPGDFKLEEIESIMGLAIILLQTQRVIL